LRYEDELGQLGWYSWKVYVSTIGILKSL